MAATVLLPASLVALRAEGLLLAEAGGVQTIRSDAQRDEVLRDGIRPANAKTQVVFRGTALVAVAFDVHFDGRVVLQKLGGLGQRGASIRTKVGLVVVEVGVAHFLGPNLIDGRLARLFDRWRRIHGDVGGGTGRAAGTGGRDRVGGGVGRRNLGGALGSDGANVGGDGELRGIGRIPAQGCRFAFIWGSGASLQLYRGA